MADFFTVYLIRHARPAEVYDAPSGPPLSIEGRLQAAMAADFLQSRPPLVIYTSPLERALQTAQIMAMHLDVPVAIDERLTEHRSEETSVQVIARVVEFWRERVVAVSPGRIALVSHGLPIRAMLAALGDVMIANPEHYRFDAGNIAPYAGIWRALRVATGRACRWDLALIFRTVASSATPVRAGHQRPPTSR